MRCTTLDVPVHHARPDDDGRITLGLAASRHDSPRSGAARSSSTPAVPPRPAAPARPDGRDGLAERTEWCDVITFDARGYGTSTPIRDADVAPPVGAVLDSEGACRDNQAAVERYGPSCVEQDAEPAANADAESPHA